MPEAKRESAIEKNGGRVCHDGETRSNIGSDGVALPVFGGMFFRVRRGIVSLFLRRATAVVCGHSRNYFEDSSFGVATSQLTNLLIKFPRTAL